MKIKRILIISPVFNDWSSVQILINDIDSLDIENRIDVILVDDASTEPYDTYFSDQTYKSINGIHILPLCRNFGHQRAIGIGLAYAYANFDFDCTIVMDGDGEDRPEDIPRLLKAVEETNNSEIIFAKRAKRSESFQFKLFYYFYIFFFRLLTGLSLKAGNFSAVPHQFVRQLVKTSELWMHYSSSILKLKLPFSYIITDRGSRYVGHSKMNFVSFVLHGLQAIAIHRETAVVRIIFFCFSSIIVLVFAVLTVIGIRMFTDLAIPGWTSNLVGIFTIILLQIIALSLFFVFLVLGNRSVYEVIPSYDYLLFIKPCINVYCHE